VKKTLILLTVLFIVILSNSVFAVGDVIFSRPYDNTNYPAYSSVYAFDQLYHQCFTDFYYDGSFTMTDFHWWGMGYDIPDINGFTFQIYSNAAGAPAPGALLYDEYFAGDANAQYFDTNPQYGDVYKYGIDLTTPFTPLETGYYWFSVYAHTGSSNWFWSLGSGYDFNRDWQNAEISGDPFWQNPAEGDFAFEITGTNVIPEPGTLILLGLGLLGLAARRIKR
jgi:hypothetical protein